MKSLHTTLAVMLATLWLPAWADAAAEGARSGDVLLALNTSAAPPPAPTIITAVDSNRNELLDTQLLRLSATSPYLMRSIVKGMPYSAEVVTETNQLLAGGNRISQRTVGYQYRDSAGRTRRDSDRGAAGGMTVQVIDPVAMHAITWRVEDKRGVMMALQAAPEAPRPAPVSSGGDSITIKFDNGNGSAPSPASRSVGAALAPVISNAVGDAKWIQKSVRKDLGTRDFDGISAKGTLSSYEIPAGEVGNSQPIVVTTEMWIAQELGLVIYSRNADPRSSERITRYTNIRRSEVPASTFAAPADYVIKEIAR